MEVAYFTLSDKQLYANLDKLLELLEGPKAILPTPPPYKIMGGGGGGWPLLPPPCSYSYVRGAGGVKNFSVGICDGAPSTARSSWTL